MPDLKKAIIKTLTYFDLQNHPLTLVELYTLLFKVDGLPAPSFDAVLFELNNLENQNLVESQDGFVVLAGRKNLIVRRLDAYPLYLKRLQRASRLVKILRYVPYIRGIAISGSLAGMYSQEESDIDFLVVTKPKRIWVARLLLSSVTQILGVRRHGEHIANRVCLNHYVVEGLSLPSDHTLYSAVEYASLLCLLNASVFDDFLQKQGWLKNFLAFPPKQVAVSPLTVGTSRTVRPVLEGLLELLGASFWERLARILQKRRIELGPNILVSDQELSFHPGSKGALLLSRFESRTGKGT